MSKHDLLKHWPIPEYVRDVASFVGFLQFYSKFIPHFEVRAEPLRWIMQREYTKLIGDLWTPDARATFDDLRNSILCESLFATIQPITADSTTNRFLFERIWLRGLPGRQ